MAKFQVKHLETEEDITRGRESLSEIDRTKDMHKVRQAGKRAFSLKSCVLAESRPEMEELCHCMDDILIGK